MSDDLYSDYLNSIAVSLKRIADALDRAPPAQPQGPATRPATRPRSLPCDPLNLGLTATARVLGVSRSRIDQLIKEGHLEAVWLGRRRLVRYESIVAYSEALRREI
jgi:excisionase family DNA binding protein